MTAASKADRSGSFSRSGTSITTGPIITTKITGLKNRIMGTVSRGGRATALRRLRFSFARTRKAVPSGVP